MCIFLPICILLSRKQGYYLINSFIYHKLQIYQDNSINLDITTFKSMRIIPHGEQSFQSYLLYVVKSQRAIVQ